jgi:hypothetical protein
VARDQISLDIGADTADDCLHQAKAICAFRKSNGKKDIAWFCHDCGTRISNWLKHSEIWKRKLKWAELEVVVDNTLGKPCAVDGCTRRGVELHHWAPTTHCERFGDLHERWPTSWLCRHHHAEWHRIVTPDLAAHAVTLIQLGAKQGTTIRELMDAVRDKLAAGAKTKRAG